MKNENKSRYIIADHTRAICFLIQDGVTPSAKQQGYVLRRLIRRSLSAALTLNIDISNSLYFKELVESVTQSFEEFYPELKENEEKIQQILIQESTKYTKAVARGEKEWPKELQKIEAMNLGLEETGVELAKKTFDLYQTHGVPIEVSEKYLENNNKKLDLKELDKLLEQHQNLSQTTSAGQFKSGLGDHSGKSVQLHTATHLLHQVLREVLGQHVKQKGSAIKPDKARFDFSHDQKLTDDELSLIQQKVQNLINLALKVEKKEMSLQEAKDLGAIGLFGEKYGEIVTVYSVLDSNNQVFSREFCGGPHVTNTTEIGVFEILKQESLGQDTKRLIFTVN